MGAEQSSSKGQAENKAASESSSTRKRCYYEVLGLERTATEDEIKKAYRKKALELHPDRNFGDVDRATKLFAEVQAANEVLSDPQEKAWYDSHRDYFLSNDDSTLDEYYSRENGENPSFTSTTDIVKLMAKFNPRVPFTDEPNGFFGSLAIFFETLAKEEATARDICGLDRVEYPEFGNSSSGYEDVVRPFYAVWMGFGTRKSYSWKDQYMTNMADRYTRRASERENQRLRDKGIREFNEAVRSLVAFVRKRDPRYLPNTQSEAERQKILRNAALSQAARSRAANKAKIDAHVIPDWAQTRDEEDQTAFSDLEESESEVEHIECVVCNKTFKSEKQYEAHEKSKKHIKAVQQLKRQMQKENKHLNLDKAAGSGASTAYSTPRAESEEASNASEDEDEGIAQSPSATQQASVDNDSKDGIDEEDPSPKTGLGSNTGAIEEDSSEIDENDEYAPRKDIENRILGHQSNTPTENPKLLDEIEEITNATATTSILGNSDSIPKPKIGKAKAKRAKKAARQQEGKTKGT